MDEERPNSSSIPQFMPNMPGTASIKRPRTDGLGSEIELGSQLDNTDVHASLDYNLSAAAGLARGS